MNLSGATFGNTADLRGATFGNRAEANLGGVTFGDKANLSRVTFGDAAASGQSTAISAACCSIQLPVTTGLPNRSRRAFAVDETGFHIAIVPSQLGMRCDGVKTLEIIPNGNQGEAQQEPPAEGGECGRQSEARRGSVQRRR